MRESQAVLLKPGDLLVIGNVGPMTAEGADHLSGALQSIKEALGLAGAVAFEGDIDLRQIKLSDLEQPDD